MGARRRQPPLPPVVVTKTLVAHIDQRPESFGVPYRPEDGDPIGVPEPCTRLLAGYWCACGWGFVSVATGESTFRARVVSAGDAERARYIAEQEPEYGSDGWHRSSSGDLGALQRAVEDLEVGTVVERHGAVVARAFGYSQPIPSSEHDWAW